MSESSIEKYRGLEKVEETEDLSLLMSDEDKTKKVEEKEGVEANISLSQDEVDQMLGIAVGEMERRELTPEKVAQAWIELSDLERKFVNCPQEQFDSIIPEYEKVHGRSRSLIITALRKLISNNDSRAALINRVEGEAAG